MLLDASLPPVPFSQVPETARAAEETGFAALWTAETQHDPFLPCALIAEHTSRMHFGTAIAVSFARSPANLAYTAWDLAAQSGGRFILGLGTHRSGGTSCAATGCPGLNQLSGNCASRSPPSAPSGIAGRTAPNSIFAANTIN